jgi:hypothetical protein
MRSLLQTDCVARKPKRLDGAVTANACLYPAVRRGGATVKGEPCQDVRVKVDTGATRTVVPAALVPTSDFSRGTPAPAWLADGTEIELPTTDIYLQLPGCRTLQLVALVSDKRAKERGVLVGHDYLEAADVIVEPRKRLFRCRKRS